MGAEAVTLRNVLDADRRIRGIVNRTPAYHSVTFSRIVGADVFLKLECFQPVGVFKIRGAANKICSLSQTELKKGLICASSGNHGLAVSYVSKICGAKATIIVPTNAVEEKVIAIRDYGAEVIKLGNDYDEAHAKACMHAFAIIACVRHSLLLKNGWMTSSMRRLISPVV